MRLSYHTIVSDDVLGKAVIEGLQCTVVFSPRILLQSCASSTAFTNKIGNPIALILVLRHLYPQRQPLLGSNPVPSAEPTVPEPLIKVAW